MDKSKGWGKICLGTRLEKQVEADFMLTWTGLLLRGQRKGDTVKLSRGFPAHVSANEIIRSFLRETDCDSVLFLDSDAEVEDSFISQLRDYEAGWEYDGLQAFYVKRNNPSEPIWFYRDGDTMVKCLVLNEGHMEVGLIGTHCALFRREVFEAIYEAYGEGIKFEDFEWFCYPRHQHRSDEVMLSLEAADLGFRLGATTDVRAGHISKAAIGWDEYNQWILDTHAKERTDYFTELAGLVAEFTGEDPRTVEVKSLAGSKNVSEPWNTLKPETADQVRSFYGLQDNGYLYDLLGWNWSELYWKLISSLREIEGKRVLVIGAGLGTEVAILADRNQVDVFELPGVLKDFCKFRLGDKVSFMEGDNLDGQNGYHIYDLIVAIDVIEHVHPDDLDGFLSFIDSALKSNGALFTHNNFKQADIYPMHFDHSERFEAWLQTHNTRRVKKYEYSRDQMPQLLPEP